jgi:hypothetical protein
LTGAVNWHQPLAPPKKGLTKNTVSLKSSCAARSRQLNAKPFGGYIIITSARLPSVR